MKTLKPLQKEAVEKMLYFLRTNAERGCYNASEMGTGKSIMTLSVVNNLKPKSTLIICPSVIKLNWREEILSTATTLSTKDPANDIWIINSAKEIKEQSSRTKLPLFTIVSYRLSQSDRVHKFLASKKPDLLVLDEAHYVKNSKSKRTQAVLQSIWPSSYYRICLSGTPFTRSIEDCWTLFRRLNPYEFNDYYRFMNRYCYVETTPWGINYYGLKNADELSGIIRKNFYLRYTLEEMAEEVPSIIWNPVHLSKDEYGVKPSKKELEDNKTYITLLNSLTNDDKAIPTPPKSITKQRIEQGQKKIPAVVEFVKNLVDNKVPTLVFFTYLEAMRKFITSMTDYEPAIIYGEVEENKRYAEIKRFQEGKTNLFILQCHAGGIGINLQRAGAVVFAELDYSPAVVGQSIGRAQRIGRTLPLNVYYITVVDTIDAEIARAIMTKSRMFKKIVDNNE